MRGTIARAIDEAHHFAGVGERDQERMITPGAIVGDVDTFFVLGIGGHQSAVGIENGAIEKGVGLLSPHADANLAVDVLQDVDGFGSEASAEIAGSGGIGNALGAEGVEEVDIVAAQFDVLEAIAVAKSVVGEIEDMIGFVVGHVNLEEMEFAIDGVDKADALGEEMKGADAAMADAMNAVGDFVVDIAGGENGAIGAAGFGFIEPALDTALVSVEAMS